jgi:hypothetical protein
MGWFGMRERASLRQVKGSTPDHWHRATKLRNTVAVAALVAAREYRMRPRITGTGHQSKPVRAMEV